MKVITTMKIDEFDVLKKLIENSKNERDAIKHIILFARNESRSKEQKRSLNYYTDLVLEVTNARPKD